jgi:hypothetical protein
MLAHEGRAAALKAKRKRPVNKLEKRAVERVATELRRLNAALRDSNLPTSVRKFLPNDLLKERETELGEMARRPLEKPKRPGVYLKKKAAQYASLTLQDHGIRRTTTRGGELCKLAAAYYGDRDADLFDAVRVWRNVDHLDASED